MTRQTRPSIRELLRDTKGWALDAAPPSDLRGQPTDGVSFVGYLRTESGVGSAARGYVQALQHLGVPLSLTDISGLQGNRAQDVSVRPSESAQPHATNIICADIELHFAILAQLGESFFKDRYNIGIWAWELLDFPARWYDRFAYYDEIWVGTSFIAEALAPISPVPVVRVPPVLMPMAAGSRTAGRRRLGVSPDETVYLAVFDFHSHLERKNPLAAIEAFTRAFTPSDRARLVIKCVNGESDPAGMAAMRSLADGHRVSIYDGYWPAEQIRDLMAACDAYVSLHRSEGTGLTISDAMALGTPVIATGWSGNMDFMTAGNSYPVSYDLVEIQESVGPYPAGAVWAEPSVDEAALLMRRVFEHRDEAAARGHAARRDIERRYSVDAVAGLIERRLEAIDIRRQMSELKRAIWQFHASYRGLGERIQDVVDARLPSDATVLVVSKGDESLLQLGGRVGWHFPGGASGYAGYYPADGTAAVQEVERLRAGGADFLLFPGPARWWLDHYPELDTHLRQRYRVVADQEDVCLIFALDAGAAEPQWLVSRPRGTHVRTRRRWRSAAAVLDRHAAAGEATP